MSDGGPVGVMQGCCRSHVGVIQQHMAVQELAQLLWQLKTGGHKALIFTQMTKMLDVLEAFLNLHGYTYLRLDGTTKPEQRQASSPFHLLKFGSAPHGNLQDGQHLDPRA